VLEERPWWIGFEDVKTFLASTARGQSLTITIELSSAAGP
jgi:hypothetical protein